MFNKIKGLATKVYSKIFPKKQVEAKAAPTPTPDPWVEKGYTKSGGGYYRKSDSGYTTVDKEKIARGDLEMIEGKPRTTPTPQAVSTGSNSGPGFHIEVPSDNGRTMKVPSRISQMMGEELDKYGLATPAAEVLHHPMQSTAITGEQKRGVNTGPNRGENPSFQPSGNDMMNNDGSIDRGLFRINSNTFTEMNKSAYWGSKMREMGIHSWDDMNDSRLNTRMAYLLGERSRMSNMKRWRPWYAAPTKLRE